jgi:hypothetical protein
MGQPPLDFFLNPARLRGLWGGHVAEELGLAECGFDGRPEAGACLEVAFIPEYAHGSEPVPGLGDATEGSLDGGRQFAIGCMAIGNALKSIVFQLEGFE